MEICFVPKTDHSSQYPGLFVFTNPARLVRPVKNLVTDAIELIGTMEQVYLHIALKDNGILPEVIIAFLLLLIYFFKFDYFQKWFSNFFCSQQPC